MASEIKKLIERRLARRKINIQNYKYYDDDYV